MNMYRWIEQQIDAKTKKPLPILSFPAVQELGVTVAELVRSSELQAQGIRRLAEKYAMPAAFSYMDLSIEAEAFGAHCVYSDSEIPTIVGALISTPEQAAEQAVPPIGAGRTTVAIEGVKQICSLVTDRPVFANCCGPYSLAGRLMDVNEIMLLCYEDPDMVHDVLRKVTDFSIAYINAFKAAGANGVIMAEPLAGLLSPDLMAEFSSAYVKEIIDAVQTEEFIVIYHNCGPAVNRLIPEILSTGCRAFHFGDSIQMKEVLPQIPQNVLVMGNISPSRCFINGTPELITAETAALLAECTAWPNFLISSGCDIMPNTPADNVRAFFDTVENFYQTKA